MSEDICPKCGGQLEYEEVDIGVGIQRGNPGCPDCHWVPLKSQNEQAWEDLRDDGGLPESQDIRSDFIGNKPKL